MISVEEALEAVLSLAAPVPGERVGLRAAAGRILAEPVVAGHDQPPFPASAMDGYAVRDADVAPGATLRVVGEAAAGRPWDGAVEPGRAVRIFTGGAVPQGADRVVIQEDVTRDGDAITLGERLDAGPYVRPAGGDFRAGARLEAGLALTPERLALVAAMGCAEPVVRRRPVVALMATGDELVPPGEALGRGQVIASNAYGLAAMAELAGAEARLLPIARDDETSLRQGFELAAPGEADGADLIVTIGGASVGDHDLVAPVARALGMEPRFHRVAMRPGKPLMAGRLRGATVLGVPGNPVSSLVCGRVFMVPAIRAMLGLDAGLGTTPLPLAGPLGPNGARAHYMRAVHTPGGALAAQRQDSSLLSVLAGADLLIVRPPHDGPRAAGEVVPCLPLR